MAPSRVRRFSFGSARRSVAGLLPPRCAQMVCNLANLHAVCAYSLATERPPSQLLPNGFANRLQACAFRAAWGALQGGQVLRLSGVQDWGLRG